MGGQTADEEQVDAVHAAGGQGHQNHAGNRAVLIQKYQQGGAGCRRAEKQGGGGKFIVDAFQQGGGQVDAQNAEHRKDRRRQDGYRIAQTEGFRYVYGHPGGDPVPQDAVQHDGEHGGQKGRLEEQRGQAHGGLAGGFHVEGMDRVPAVSLQPPDSRKPDQSGERSREGREEEGGPPAGETDAQGHEYIDEYLILS